MSSIKSWSDRKVAEVQAKHAEMAKDPEARARDLGRQRLMSVWAAWIAVIVIPLLATASVALLVVGESPIGIPFALLGFGGALVVAVRHIVRQRRAS